MFVFLWVQAVCRILYIHVYIHIYWYIHKDIYDIHFYVCTRAYIYLVIYMCMYRCIIHIYICIHMFISIYIQVFFLFPIQMKPQIPSPSKPASCFTSQIHIYCNTCFFCFFSPIFGNSPSFLVVWTRYQSFKHAHWNW